MKLDDFLKRVRGLPVIDAENLLAGVAFADGMVVRPPNYNKEVFIPEQKAVIFWDGSTEKLILESKISVEDIANVAWVVPIQSSTKPIVETADEQIFYRLADLFRPPTLWHKALTERACKRMLKKAKAVFFITDGINKKYTNSYAELSHKFYTAIQGYDSTIDMPKRSLRDKKMIFLYTGSFFLPSYSPVPVA